MIEVGSNAYGKEAIRLVKIDRGTTHRVRDLRIGISLTGDFATSYSEGDNSGVIATDTMKNTAYALAGDHLTGAIEDFGLALARHFLGEPQVERATITLREHGWLPIGAAPDAFTRDGSWTRTARVSVGRDTTEVRGGITDLAVMKTAHSAFAGFPRDRFTTLKETDDRILATAVTADWRYDPFEGLDFDAGFEGVRSTFLDAFAAHHSESVQHSIWIVGKAILERHPDVAEVSMSLPNLHHWTADLSPFDIENDRAVYVATTEPHGLIEATIRRGDAGPSRS
jgi:urate oxidase